MGPGVECKVCGANQVMPIPILSLMVESDEGTVGLPVALVCMACHTQSVHWAEWSIKGDDTDG